MSIRVNITKNNSELLNVESKAGAELKSLIEQIYTMKSEVNACLTNEVEKAKPQECSSKAVKRNGDSSSGKFRK